MDRALPPPPKKAGVVQIIDLSGVTRLVTNGVKYYVNRLPIVGLRDALILRSYHILDADFKKRLDSFVIISGEIPGEIAWEITRQIGLGVALVATNAVVPSTSLVSLSAAAPTSGVELAKATAKAKSAVKPKAPAKRKTRKSQK